MEKGEIANFEQFHLFPQCFPKAFFFNVSKRVYMEEKVNISATSIEPGTPALTALADLLLQGNFPHVLGPVYMILLVARQKGFLWIHNFI